MNAVFFETRAFTARRGDYLSEEGYRTLQNHLLQSPQSGDLMQRTGGFRKLRWYDERRHKGKRGGLRVIYYWLEHTSQFWMFAIYDKDEMSTLSPDQEKQLKQAIERELKQRGLKQGD